MTFFLFPSSNDSMVHGQKQPINAHILSSSLLTLLVRIIPQVEVNRFPWFLCQPTYICLVSPMVHDREWILFLHRTIYIQQWVFLIFLVFSLHTYHACMVSDAWSVCNMAISCSESRLATTFFLLPSSNDSMVHGQKQPINAHILSSSLLSLLVRIIPQVKVNRFLWFLCQPTYICLVSPMVHDREWILFLHRTIIQQWVFLILLVLSLHTYHACMVSDAWSVCNMAISCSESRLAMTFFLLLIINFILHD